MTDVPDLARTAHDTRAVVIGAGLAGLVAAYRFAQVGMNVTVIERQDVLGGTLQTRTVGDHAADVLASTLTEDGDLRRLLDELGLADSVLEQATVRRTTIVDGEIRTLPDGVLGIPANPFAPETTAIIGWGGAWRAYLDRLRPVLTIGHEKNLGTLVRSRMGAKVAERIVGPVARASYGIGVDDVDVEVAAPTLNAALTRVGSLTGAVAELLSDAPAPALFLEGGVATLISALERHLVDLGATIHGGAEVSAITRDGTGFTVDVAAGDGDDRAELRFGADVLVIAADEESARDLLTQAGASVSGDVLSRPAVTVTLAVDAGNVPDIGAGVSTQLDEPAVWSIDDVTAQRGASTATRLLRVRLSPVAADRDDADLVKIAADEASRLLQTRLIVRDSAVGRALAAPVGARRGHADRESAVRSEVAAVPGLGVVGAWVAGSGIASVSADAGETAEALRRAVLFG